ncbi:MAG: sigma-54-dependent Fis family transcriptional regulator [Gammaproteobacteria bacterium]|nr:sigma-54-dependent Fis family transcriptional regulator [Gammaproteobacteria bacterium]
MSNELALIIDDEPDILELLGITLERMDVPCITAENLEVAKRQLKNHTFNICITDMRLPDGDGVEFISYIQEHNPQLPVIIITAHGSIETAISALKLGAFDFLTKPVDLGRLRNLIENALNIYQEQPLFEHELIGDSAAIYKIRELVTKLSRNQAPVYISGESGVGKELVAKMIHEQGPRSTAPFVPVNCGAIPHELIESELFGHVKGSFTGAVSDKKGLFETANGGTLFLDEIAELPFNLQVKILRAIQEKSIRPVGSQHEQSVDVRILSATHKDLSAMVDLGHFRKDLFYRINVIELNIPPLRERMDDIPLLVDHIVNKINKDSDDHSNYLALSQDALSALKNYSFPGNIRELENILQRAQALSDGNVIDVNDLQLPDIDKVSPQNEKDDHNLDVFLADQEKEKIIAALEQTKWNKTAAAKLLGISFRALRYRLEKLGID